MVPTILQIVKSESPILSLRFSSLQCVLSPHSLGVLELALPRMDVAVQVGNQLVLLMTHTSSVMRYTRVGLLTEPQITLRDQDVPHR